MSMHPRRFALSLHYVLLCAFLCAAGLSGCGEWNGDAGDLTARSASAAQAPDCASCHGYPLKDRNHDYHLFKAGGSYDLNGEITCVDCHSRSIRWSAATLFDTVYEHPTGERWNTLDHPNAGDKTTDGIVIRSMNLLEIDTLNRHVAAPAPARPGATPLFQEYLTALAHLNGQVDVSFDGKNSTPGKFGGDSASYNPERETCSAVACHPGTTKVYSWGSVAKGLPELKDKEEP
jgi:hypothetical protein